MFWSREQIAEVTMLVPAGLADEASNDDRIQERGWYGRRLPRELPFLTRAGAWNAWNRGSLTPCFSLEPAEKRHVADVFTCFMVWGAVGTFVLYAWWPALMR